jgi:Bifunctional DNA primase/polymerase, N-terminal
MTILAEALELHQAGYATIRATVDGQKRPLGKWEKYQAERPSEDQIIEWFADGHAGIGIITGAVSGNTEMLEFEGRAVQEGLLSHWVAIMDASGLSELRERLRGWVEQSPTGGYHIHYRVHGKPVAGNTKLARRPATADELAANSKDKIRVLIETRGEGGFVVTAPSNGTTHVSGKPWLRISGMPATTPILTADEHDALWDICRTLDAMPEPVEATHEPISGSTGDRPGDDYNSRADWADILVSWTKVYTQNEVTYWRRPGKNIGVSATTGRNDADNLYVFTTSTEFDDLKPYSKFAAYTLLEHRGDYSAAAKALRAQGYGAESEGPTVIRIPNRDDFWTARPELIHIRDFARSRRVSPWALLGITLARTVAATPTFVVLPALVGGQASLNLFVGIVGRSGAGKGGAEAAAVDVIHSDIHTETFTVGSGEAIAHAYMERKYNKDTKDYEAHQHNDRALFSIAEIDTLDALHKRQSSTILPELRKAWMGERLGFHYVEKAKRLPVPAHHYRLCLIAGIQPERAGVLLDDIDGGTPQRFIWLPAIDTDAPDTVPDEPQPWPWKLPQWPMASAGRVILPVCQIARGTIDDARLQRLRGNADTLDGHALLTRLKVGAALALLAQRSEVTEQDWDLANIVMAVSDTVRAGVVSTLTAATSERNKARGKAEAERVAIVDQSRDEAAVNKAARAVLRRLDVVGNEGELEGKLRANSLAPQDRTCFSEAIERLADSGLIDAEKTDQSIRYRRRKS